MVVYYLEGHSYGEAAEMLGVRVRTFKTRLYRARKMLRETLRQVLWCGGKAEP